MIALMLAALDQTIVSTAGPAIQHDLRIPPALYACITTAYLVAATVMVPIYGKLSDRLGRKPVLLAGILIFLAGSLLCGIAWNATALIVFRAVQGLGAASLFTSTLAVIADLFPPAERGRYSGVIGGVMGIASLAGPLVGGFITDNFGWHWVFFVNLPLGAIAVWFVASRMPSLGGQAPEDRRDMDVAGALWLIMAVVPLLVALSLGRSAGMSAGDGFAWGSWQILSMFAVAAMGAAAFARTELRAHDPILHFEIFRDRVISLSLLTMFVLGSVFLSAVVFLPLFLVNVVGVSATRAGVTMMPLTLAVVVASVASGQLVSHIGRYRVILLSSLAILAAGFAVLGFTLTPTTSQASITLQMIVIGLGIGPSLPLYTLIAQNVAVDAQLGVVTAASMFARSLGQVIGVALLGTIFAAGLQHQVQRRVGTAVADAPPVVRDAVRGGMSAGQAGGEGAAAVAFDTAAVKGRVRQVLAAGNVGIGAPATAASALAAVDRVAEAFRVAFTKAIAALYMVSMAATLLAFVLTWMIPERPLRRHHGDAPVLE